MLPPVLGREVIPTLTGGAFHNDVFSGHGPALFQDLRHHAGADGAAALADREAQPLLHRDRRDQLDRHLRVVPRHHHLHPRRQLHPPRHIRRAEVKLPAIPLEKRPVPPPLLPPHPLHFASQPRVPPDPPPPRPHRSPLP